MKIYKLYGKIQTNFKNFLDKEFESAKSYKPNKADWLEGDWTGLSTASFDARKGLTSVKENELLEVAKAIYQIPEDFNAHKKIKKIHNYETPEIISFPFNILTDDYKDWFNLSLEKKLD